MVESILILFIALHLTTTTTHQHFYSLFSLPCVKTESERKTTFFFSPFFIWIFIRTLKNSPCPRTFSQVGIKRKLKAWSNDCDCSFLLVRVYEQGVCKKGLDYFFRGKKRWWWCWRWWWRWWWRWGKMFKVSREKANKTNIYSMPVMTKRLNWPTKKIPPDDGL